MSEKRKHRTFNPEQKTAIVLDGLRGDRRVMCAASRGRRAPVPPVARRAVGGGKAALGHAA